jgi:CBS-domain-containing membrane protein
MFLNAGQTQEEAWNLLRTHGVSGAPVLDRGGLVGVITRSDLADPRRRAPETSGTVADAMTRLVYAVRASDPAMVAVRLMLEEEIHRAVVINADGSLAGIISLTDILRALAHGVDLRDPSVTGCAVDFVDLRTLRGSKHPRLNDSRTRS